MTRIRTLTLGLVCVIAITSHVMGSTGQVGTCLKNVTKLGSIIQVAVNNLPPNSTLDVCPGIYPEQVLVTQGITIRGVKDPNSTADAAVIAAPIGGIVANTTSLSSGNPIAAQLVADTTTASGPVNISNITIDGSNNQINGCAPDLIGIYYRNASGTVTEVNAINQALSAALNGCQSGLGIFVQSGGSLTSTVTVQNSYVANYQKNGITGNEHGTTLTATSNIVFGQGPTTGAAENGMQFGFGAAGSATSNTVMDNVYSPAGSSGDAATGILVYASGNISVKSNTIGNSQLGITFDSDPTFGSADHGTINSNNVSATHLFDGIDLCSNSNAVHSNTIIGSDESAVHLDSACGSTGNNNNVTHNVINNSCAGILKDPATANTIASNTFHNVTNTNATGPTCTIPPRGGHGKKQALTPNPTRP
jgi:hypothetical protein